MGDGVSLLLPLRMQMEGSLTFNGVKYIQIAATTGYGTQMPFPQEENERGDEIHLQKCGQMKQQPVIEVHIILDSAKYAKNTPNELQSHWIKYCQNEK